jgi:hypothetical protein
MTKTKVEEVVEEMTILKPNRDSLWPRKFHVRTISLVQSSIISKSSKHAHPNGQFYTYCVFAYSVKDPIFEDLANVLNILLTFST